jgi:uncharacterized protein YbaA (DUF1428 family)
MPVYIDGFLLAVPKRKVAAYRKMSRRAGKIWRKYGALEYRECVGDDLNIKMGRPFAKAAGLRSGETAVFSWILYRSKADRNRVNKKVMSDKRIAKMMKDPMPFDVKRMSMGGFKVIVDV